MRHNGCDGVSNHQPNHDLLNRLQIKENIKAPRHWPLCGEFTGDRWIPHTSGQLRGKCFHLMTSSCHKVLFMYQARVQLTPVLERVCMCFLAATLASHIDGLMQDCSNSSALAMELLLFCTKPSTCYYHHAGIMRQKHFPRYWPVVRGILPSSVVPLTKDQGCGTLVFPLLLTRTNSWRVLSNDTREVLKLMLSHYNDFDKSTFVQVMAWCRQATSHYLSHWWPILMSPYGVTMP